MLDYHISFHSPWYLLLLLFIPPVWVMSIKSLRALGRVRSWAVLALRTAVILLLVAALADVQWVRTSERLTVVYLLDQSLSIPAEHRQAMIEYVNASISKHREGKDRAGVVVFGRDAAIEIPPLDGCVQVPPAIESVLDPEHTDLAGAMRLAQASFPEDAAKRIVIVSDGNENLGDALKQAQALCGSGIGIDVVPVRYQNRAEVSVQRLSIPADIRRGQPFDMKVVVNNSSPPGVNGSGNISGRIVLSQLVGDRTQVLSDQRAVLPPGKKVLTLRQQIDSPAFYKYQVRFVPDRPADDGRPQNNRSTAFTNVRGRGRVLLIEDHEKPGRFDVLAGRLRKQNIEITIQPTNRLFSGMADLMAYDAVVIGDVGREQFTASQIEMLVCNTQQMGAGLVVLGGANSFGAGGWTNSKLEEAMPVEFQIKSAKVVPVGALVLVIDSSSSMTGQKIELCKSAALASAKTLGNRDFIGVATFNSEARWVVPMTRVGESSTIGHRISRIGACGGTNMQPGMEMGYQGILNTDASIKHMIVLSDGHTMGSGYEQLAGKMYKKKITVSTVAVGDHADAALLGRIAIRGGGKFHRVKNPKALPRIFMKEARRVARPLIYESKPGVRPQVQLPHEMVRGVEGSLPPIHGFVMTTVKDNPLVEVAIASPKPSGNRNNTILAGWNYGLGKAVAFTTDVGSRWATGWTAWEGYDKLFGQIVRWSMRPSQQSGKFNVSTRIEDGKAQVVVAALDKDDEFINFLSIDGHVVGPNLKPAGLKLRQTAPGRYVGEFPAVDSGSYFLMVNPGQGRAPIRTGFNVPYSSEFSDLTTNEALLDELAGLNPKDGGPGAIIEASPDAPAKPLDQLLAVNTFRHNLPKATSSQEAWHYVLLAAACIFFADVFTRRVQVSFEWLPPLAARVRNRMLGRQSENVEPEYMERLQSRKAEVAGQFEQTKTNARFELPEDAPAAAGVSEVEELAGNTPTLKQKKQPHKPSIAAEQKPEEESYTQRLLKAKQKVWENRDENK